MAMVFSSTGAENIVGIDYNLVDRLSASIGDTLMDIGLASSIFMQNTVAWICDSPHYFHRWRPIAKRMLEWRL
jgi:hypothetical protein